MRIKYYMYNMNMVEADTKLINQKKEFTPVAATMELRELPYIMKSPI